MSLFKETCKSMQRRYGDKFVPPTITRMQEAYFKQGQRLEVTSPSGYVRRGTISITTGWEPVLLLIHRRNASGSWDTLNHTDAITACIDKRGRRHPLNNPWTQFLEIVR